MTFRLALRALLSRPVRSAVLACAFGLGVSVMANLLGIGEVILEQARAPALRGGGHIGIGGATGPLPSAKFILSNVLGSEPLAADVAAASPSVAGILYLVGRGEPIAIGARGGVPSLERALGDPETADVAAWVDNADDEAWLDPDPGEMLRGMDRFHPIPDRPHRADSWAEWLYFNGQHDDARFYLTFLVGPRVDGGRRSAGVRLQLDRNGRLSSYSASAEVDEAELLASAPDMAIGANRVRLDGTQYLISLDLQGRAGPESRGRERLTGEIVLEVEPGRSFPPISIDGANGWTTGYVVPVLSGVVAGTLEVGGERVTLDGGRGYHDHNWGYWEGVSWRWGQVQHEDVSFVYGRVYPPPDAADPERMPGFLTALGPDGPIGYATRVTIEEEDDPDTGQPRRIVVRGQSREIRLEMELDVEAAEVTQMDRGSFGPDMDFWQLRASYRVTGSVGGREVDFTAPGAAETFRQP
ncbi:MAG: hypothetical protein QGG24_03230 [Vicinamibacterales bacterium]|jgi:hypothetical protein|nr:hypothetical protein [Acidobacteriota bacterium]MDP7294313.1 hypothetical protein [Vicinamibacterales bacterium]MDP7471773.1 hypothetical protein [Vicinamibacterales bacterium]MDP7670336.1 hypothetical protein [Vicinamibacterales bacterium]HJO37993.1 hypothetical protein [Vicinamibacterales bacterium]